eukprot:9085-Pelagococcus_subviridis.AAC.5
MPFNSASDVFQLHPDVALNDGMNGSQRVVDAGARRAERRADELDERLRALAAFAEETRAAVVEQGRPCGCCGARWRRGDEEKATEASNRIESNRIESNRIVSNRIERRQSPIVATLVVYTRPISLHRSSLLPVVLVQVEPFIVQVDVLRHLPDLQDVILRDGRDDHVVVSVPREIGDLAGVPAVDEHQLRRAVLRVLRGLLVPDPAQIPHHEPPVRAARREVRFVLRRPSDLEHLLGVVRKRVQTVRQVPNVEDRDRLVRAPGREDVLVERVKREAVHLRVVRVDALQRRLLRRLPRVPQQKLLVVADASEHVLVRGVPRDVLDDAEVPLVDLQRVDRLRALPERALNVPEADLRVVAAGEQTPFFERRPR